MALKERGRNETIFKTELSKRHKEASAYRQVVTGNVNGRSVVQSDEQMEAYQFKTVPGYEHTLIWVNTASPDLSKEQRFDRYPGSVVAGYGGTSFHFVTFPPTSVFLDPSFDGEAARDEALIRLRRLADHFEKEDPAMHKTNMVDYTVVYRWRDLAGALPRRLRYRTWAFSGLGAILVPGTAYATSVYYSVMSPYRNSMERPAPGHHHVASFFRSHSATYQFHHVVLRSRVLNP